jgi:hypothetical protein
MFGFSSNLATVAPEYLGTDGPTMGETMGELISLRKARKDAKRRQDAERAAANRLIHGRSKAQRALDEKRAEQSRRSLEAHRIDTGEVE